MGDLRTAAPAAALFCALLDADTDGAAAALRRGLRECGAHELLYAALLGPAFETIAQLRALGECDDIDMDIAVYTAQLALADLSPAPAGARAPRALVARAENDAHELGARCVANSLRSRGYAVEELGAPLASGLVAYARLTEPELVAISVTRTDLLPAARRLEAALRALPTPPAVVLGGQAVTTLTRVGTPARA